MPYGLFGKSSKKIPTTRFEKSTELKHVVTLITEMRVKEMELAIDSKKNGPDSTDQEKYGVVSELLGNIEACIQAFNNKAEPSDDTARMQEICDIANQLKTHATATLETSSHILSKPRNKKREHAGTGTQAGIIVPVAVAAIAAPWTFPTAIMGLGAAKFIADKVKAMAGLTNTEPKSYQLIKDLADTLINIVDNMSAAIAEKNNKNAAPQPG